MSIISIYYYTEIIATLHIFHQVLTTLVEIGKIGTDIFPKDKFEDRIQLILTLAALSQLSEAKEDLISFLPECTSTYGQGSKEHMRIVFELANVCNTSVDYDEALDYCKTG